MSRTGHFFDIELKEAHLNWGTEGASRATANRNPFEAYLPISIGNARTYNILRGETFTCTSSDGYFEGEVKATGSQGERKQYGKNLTKSGDMRALGYWLKDRMNAQPRDIVRITFVDENSIELTLLKD